MRWDLTPADIEAESSKLIEKSKAVYDAVVALKADNVTYENVIKVVNWQLSES